MRVETYCGLWHTVYITRIGSCEVCFRVWVKAKREQGIIRTFVLTDGVVCLVVGAVKSGCNIVRVTWNRCHIND